MGILGGELRFSVGLWVLGGMMVVIKERRFLMLSFSERMGWDGGTVRVGPFSSGSSA